MDPNDAYASRLEKIKEERDHCLSKETSKPIRQGDLVIQPLTDKFVSKSVHIHEKLRDQSIGLMTLEDFKNKKQNVVLTNGVDIKTTAERKKRKASELTKLSFDDDEEEVAFFPPTKKLLKDTSVDTSFLPDREKEESDALEELQRRKDQMEKQAELKKEPYVVQYVYLDGLENKKEISVPKGTTISAFADLVRKENPGLHSTTTGDILVAKEDVILPHNMSFIDFIESNAVGKKNKVLYTHDSAQWKEQHNQIHGNIETTYITHIVARKYYDSNKHIYPLNKWVGYDPGVKR